ncbi:MAG: ABC transporter substrate-binding protein [Chloroflexota bacterium]|mgnify:CR=1 FL=1
MSKKILWLIVSGLMALSLLMPACGPPATPAAPTLTAPAAPTTPTTPAAPTAPTASTTPATSVEKGAVTPGKPKYGGTLNLVQSGDITRFDTYYAASGSIIMGSINQPLWSGDWAKGAAGGYGTKETDWGAANNDLYPLKTGYIAESSKWSLDAGKDTATIIHQIRQGVRWAQPNTEAGRLVAGRELNADDVVFNLKRVIAQGGYMYGSNPELRTANVTKTSPWEVTIKLPTIALSTGLSRLGGQVFMMPPEVINKWGNLDNWRNSIGTGAFMLTDIVPGSLVTLTRNPNSWMKDPVGPGKGNQIPYLDSVKYLIVPDLSTRQAALRSGKVDQMTGFTLEDAIAMRKTTAHLLEAEATSNQGRGTPMFMRTDTAPFSDIRVRRAMTMAVDFQSILQGVFKGRGQIITFPFSYVPEYANLYLGLDDPALPASVKELYKYQPDKAKQLLKEAGFPNGFKTEILLTSEEVDYYSIIKDMFAKVGIDMSLNIVAGAVKTNITRNWQHKALATATTSPVANFNTSVQLQGFTEYNLSILDDPVINGWLDKVRVAAPFDVNEAMRQYKEMSKYILDQAYAIPNVIGFTYTFWQPWLKNYSGEWTFGGNIPMWPQFIWYDEALKQSMGY